MFDLTNTIARNVNVLLSDSKTVNMISMRLLRSNYETMTIQLGIEN